MTVPPSRRILRRRVLATAGVAVLTAGLAVALAIPSAPTVRASLPTPTPPGPSASPSPPPPQPFVSGVTLSPDVANVGATVTVSAEATSYAGITIMSAAASIDGGAQAAMTATDSAFDSADETVTATITAPAVVGAHRVCVQATDANGLTSSGTDCAILTVYQYSSISALTLTPNPDGTVTVSAIAASSGSTIVSASVSVDGGAQAPMTATDGIFDSATESVTATVTAPTTAGAHTVCVDATDANGNTSLADCGALAPTSIGTNVPASLAYGGTTDSATFSSVTGTGDTTLTPATTAPLLPGGFQVGTSGSYYDLTTSATWSGTITVCLSYAGISPAPTQLLHYDSTKPGWVDVTSSNDTVNFIICGTVSSLSPFALVHKVPPTVTAPASVGAVASGTSGAAVTYTATAVDSTGAAMTPSCSQASGTTFPVGTTTVTCSATDAGGTGSATITVTVGYGFLGFLQPLNDPISATSPMSVFKGGSTIPVKFELTYADGTPIVSSAGSAIDTACGATISMTETSTTSAAVDESTTAATPTAGSCFRYDSTAGQFIFNESTKGLATGAQYLLTASFPGVPVVGATKTIESTHSLAVGLR